jgi:hypothetical protein
MKTNRILRLGAVCALSIAVGLGCSLAIGLHAADPPPFCTNAADQVALGLHGDAFVGDLVGCTLLNPADAGAAIECIEGKDEISPGCAGCAAAIGACGSEHCSTLCNGADNATCETCITAQCGSAFQACAGFPVYGSIDMPDTVAIGAHTSALPTDVQLCSAQHTDDPNGAIACIQQKDGLTPTCAACYAQQALCALIQCTDCVLQPDGGACAQCFAMNCVPVFALCSGLQPDQGDGGGPG